MASKKEIMNAPFVVPHKKEIDPCIFEGPLTDVVTILQTLQNQFPDARLELDYNYYYESGSHTYILHWTVPMTEAEKKTELYRRKQQCQELDRRRNRKKLIEEIKNAESDLPKALSLLSSDPELAATLLKRL